MRRVFVLLASLTLLLAAMPLAGAAPVATDRVDVVQEWNEDGTPGPGSTIGWSRLQRRSSGLDAIVKVEGLRPGGVYTFWWVVIQDDGDFPADIFVAGGGGAVPGQNGKAVVQMQAATGQPGITGFMVPDIGEIPFDSLRDPLNAVVRIEIAYHGQATDAGDELATWLSDFWTGTGCPPGTPNPIGQPHCPVYYAATHG